MKKLLTFIFIFLISTNAHAGIVSVDAFISGNDVTISHLDELRSVLMDEFNGNIESVNIKDKTIASADLADAISPIVRWDEAFNDFTFTGMLPATDSDLSSDISAGTSYVKGARIDKNAESHTYTASRDTYVYIGTGGYVFEEVSNGGAVPTTPTNTLLLAKVVTDGTQITSVTDQRTLSIQLTVASTNFPGHYRDRAIVSRDSTTTMHVGPGDIAIGTTVYTRTSNTDAKNITTAANWIEGSVPTGDTSSGVMTFLYAFNDSGSTYDFKYSSSDPNLADVDSNTVGKLRYIDNSGVDYRAVGWAWISNDTVQLREHGQIKDSTTENVVSSIGSDDINTTNTSYVGMKDMDAKYYSSSEGLTSIYWAAPIEADTITGNVELNINGSSVVETEHRGSHAFGIPISLQWSGILGQGTHDIQINWKTSSGTLLQDGAAEGDRVFIISE